MTDQLTRRPPAIDWACWLLWTLVGAGLLVSVLVWAEREELSEIWSPGGSGDSSVEPNDFLPVVLVLYAVIAAIVLFLIPLLRHGHNVARHALAIVVLGILVAIVGFARTTPPPLYQVLSIAGAVLCAVTLVFLWHPDSRRYCVTG